MADDFEDTDSTDSGLEKDWSQLERKCYNSGYREGRSFGNEESIQKGFDAGYKIGFGVSEIFHKARGQLAVKHHLQSNESEYEEKSAHLMQSEENVLKFIKNNWNEKNHSETTALEWIKMAGEKNPLDGL
eukprot:TRINITY_DN2847_c0_g1_i1.p1 TRINITY_DN2847_c0_g1~~TRINITY_DN2847_c0_g1_i1.p1  ORF type:complete len:130 (+),score=28.26 TRINITY_DN2847_c0_g1_i1:42-431(+)